MRITRGRLRGSTAPPDRWGRATQWSFWSLTCSQAPEQEQSNSRRERATSAKGPPPCAQSFRCLCSDYLGALVSGFTGPDAATMPLGKPLLTSRPKDAQLPVPIVLGALRVLQGQSKRPQAPPRVFAGGRPCDGDDGDGAYLEKRRRGGRRDAGHGVCRGRSCERNACKRARGVGRPHVRGVHLNRRGLRTAACRTRAGVSRQGDVLARPFPRRWRPRRAHILRPVGAARPAGESTDRSASTVRSGCAAGRALRNRSAAPRSGHRKRGRFMPCTIRMMHRLCCFQCLAPRESISGGPDALGGRSDACDHNSSHATWKEGALEVGPPVLADLQQEEVLRPAATGRGEGCAGRVAFDMATPRASIARIVYCFVEKSIPLEVLELGGPTSPLRAHSFSLWPAFDPIGTMSHGSAPTRRWPAGLQPPRSRPYPIASRPPREAEAVP